MLHETEEQVRMIRRSSKQAIALAMEGRWREAVAANKSIIENYPNDVDAYNRLGRAYMELGEYSLARAAYSRTKEIDPYSTIAEKNLRRLAHLKETGTLPEEGFQRVELRFSSRKQARRGSSGFIVWRQRRFWQMLMPVIR